jgi:hypothetical protein
MVSLHVYGIPSCIWYPLTSMTCPISMTCLPSMASLSHLASRRMPSPFDGIPLPLWHAFHGNGTPFPLRWHPFSIDDIPSTLMSLYPYPLLHLASCMYSTLTACFPPACKRPREGDSMQEQLGLHRKERTLINSFRQTEEAIISTVME